MAFRVVDIHPRDAAKAVQQFKEHDARIVLHNQYLNRIEELRTELEVCEPEKVDRLQGQIFELRVCLEKLHVKDSEHEKLIYEVPILPPV